MIKNDETKDFKEEDKVSEKKSKKSSKKKKASDNLKNLCDLMVEGAVDLYDVHASGGNFYLSADGKSSKVEEKAKKDFKYPTVMLTGKADVIAKLMGVEVHNLASHLKEHGVKIQYVSYFNESLFAVKDEDDIEKQSETEQETEEVKESSWEDGLITHAFKTSEGYTDAVHALEKSIKYTLSLDLIGNEKLEELFKGFNFADPTVDFSADQIKFIRTVIGYLIALLPYTSSYSTTEFEFILSDIISEVLGIKLCFAPDTIYDCFCDSFLYSFNNGTHESFATRLLDDTEDSKIFRAIAFKYLSFNELVEKTEMCPAELKKLLDEKGFKYSKTMKVLNLEEVYNLSNSVLTLKNDYLVNTLEDIAEAYDWTICQTFLFIYKHFGRVYDDKEGKVVKLTYKYLDKYIERMF